MVRNYVLACTVDYLGRADIDLVFTLHFLLWSIYPHSKQPGQNYENSFLYKVSRHSSTNESFITDRQYTVQVVSCVRQCDCCHVISQPPPAPPVDRLTRHGYCQFLKDANCTFLGADEKTENVSQ